MKRISLYMLFLFLLVGLVACSHSTDDSEQVDNGVVSKLKSDFDEFDMMEFKADGDREAIVQYPRFGSEKIDEKIENNRDHEVSDFIRLLEEKGEDGGESLNIMLHPHELKDDVFMFNTKKEVELDSDTEYTHNSILAVNTDSEAAVVTEALFDTKPTTREGLFYRLDDAVKDDPAIAPYYNPDQLEDIIMDEENDFSNVDFKDDKVQFHFGEDEIGLSAMGTPTIELPFDDVVEFLEPKIAKIVNGEDLPKNDENNDGDSKDDEDEDTQAERDIDPDEKMVALTFDDGPDKDLTPKVLDILDEYNAKATFFMLGSSIEENPETVDLVDSNGHEIENHSYTHKDMLKLSTEDVQKEVSDTDQLIEENSSQESRFFRPPYGSFNDDLAESITKDPAYWSVDTEDWLTHDKEQILNAVQNETTDGSVILMHDIHADTVESLPAVCEYLDDEGYQLVTLSELVEYRGIEVTQML